jgi:GTP cyclohydrolase IA
MEDVKRVVPMASAVATILGLMGESVDREGLLDTPSRVARMYLEMTKGLRSTPPEMTVFDVERNDQMVTILGLDYFSLCEHHLAPFYGQVNIGYIPNKRLAGLSKFARVMEYFARRLQIQERMTSQIADFIMEKLSPQGVIVSVSGTHLCMAMRGVKKPNHRTITTAIRGEINTVEFYDILKANR